MLNTIPRTDRFMSMFNTRMKFLLGNDVTLGSRYQGWETVDGHSSASPCTAVAYDGKYLYVHTLGTSMVTQLMGDMADYQGTLMADKSWNSFDIRQLRRRVAQYMAEKGIAEYDSDVGHRALWQLKIPSGIIDQRVRAYELTRDVDIGSDRI